MILIPKKKKTFFISHDFYVLITSRMKMPRNLY